MRGIDPILGQETSHLCRPIVGLKASDRIYEIRLGHACSSR